jgi:hypothetical protein
MAEILIGSPFTTVVSGGVGITPSDAKLFLAGTQVSAPVFTQIGTSTCWQVTFTPSASGVYTLHVFGAVQFRVEAVTKLSQDYLKNVEDEALGSWLWDKALGTLTLLRQNGSTLATYTVVDSLSTSSREKT